MKIVNYEQTSLSQEEKKSVISIRRGIKLIGRDKYRLISDQGVIRNRERNQRETTGKFRRDTTFN